MIYNATNKGGFKVPGYFDPDSQRNIGIIFRPQNWQANTVYYKRQSYDADIIVATVFSGVYFRVKSPGKSGNVEPVWNTAEGEETEDGSIVWEAVNYNLMPPDVDISTSTWFASPNTVVVDNATSSSTHTGARIASIPANLTSFSVTNRVAFTDGSSEDITLNFKVAQR